MTSGARLSPMRLIVLAAVFVATAALVETSQTQRTIPSRPPLRGFPIHINEWTGRVSPDFDERVVKVLGADEYLTRMYRQGAALPVDLFVGYYDSQTTGAVIHSPLNCLPGAGWQFVSRERVGLEVPASAPAAGSARTVIVNRVVMQKGEERQVALYWYHERGRVVASEYMSRAYMMLDAARYGRTDGALVRVVTPAGTDGAAEEAAARLTAFVQTIFPLLDGYLPA
jgi:EpsI family protein